MSTYDVLQCAFTLIKEEENHCRHTYATDASGRPVGSRASEAVRFCLIGAVDRARYILASANEDYNLAMAALDMAARKLFDLSVPEVNDELGHEAVKAVLNEALGGLQWVHTT